MGKRTIFVLGSTAGALGIALVLILVVFSGGSPEGKMPDTRVTTIDEEQQSAPASRVSATEGTVGAETLSASVAAVHDPSLSPEEPVDALASLSYNSPSPPAARTRASRCTATGSSKFGTLTGA